MHEKLHSIENSYAQSINVNQKFIWYVCKAFRMLKLGVWVFVATFYTPSLLLILFWLFPLLGVGSIPNPTSICPVCDWFYVSPSYFFSAFDGYPISLVCFGQWRCWGWSCSRYHKSLRCEKCPAIIYKSNTAFYFQHHRWASWHAGMRH